MTDTTTPAAAPAPQSAPAAPAPSTPATPPTPADARSMFMSKSAEWSAKAAVKHSSEWNEHQDLQAGMLGVSRLEWDAMLSGDSRTHVNEAQAQASEQA